jgi:hypothetical protein
MSFFGPWLSMKACSIPKHQILHQNNMPYLQLRTSFLYLPCWCIKLGLLSKGKLFFLCFTPNCQDSLKPVVAPTQCQILMNRQTKYIEQSTPLGYHNISLKNIPWVTKQFLFFSTSRMYPTWPSRFKDLELVCQFFSPFKTILQGGWHINI